MPEGENKADPLDEADPGQVGPYVLLGRLGAGGMGRVYLARSPGGRLVAVKVVHAHLAHDPEFRARFRHEVHAAQRVSGAFTAPVVAANPDAPTPWLATSYLDAPSLAQVIADRGPLPAVEVRSLAAGLAEALDSVHQAGVIHRDLKPSNVLMVGDGPRLIDFGIARALDATSMTGTGVVIGSPGYVSPERLVTGTVTEAADVYALGAVLCFAAVGRGPYGQGEASMLYYRTVHTEPDLAGIQDPFLRELISRCLTKDPQERPSTADLLRMLNEVQVEQARPPEAVEVEPIPVPVPEPPEPTPQPVVVPTPEPVPEPVPPPVLVWSEPVRSDADTEPQHVASTFIVPAEAERFETETPAASQVQRARRRRRYWICAASVLVVAGAAALTYPALQPSAPNLPVQGFLWSVPGEADAPQLGLWSDSSELVLGTFKGLTAYAPATGKPGWTWTPPDSDTLCGMSPSASQGAGAVDYGAYDNQTQQIQCSALQAISLAGGSPNWDKAVSLGQPDMSDFSYPNQYDSVALSIGDGIVTAPFSTNSNANDDVGDVASVALAGGTVNWASDSIDHPLPGDCALDGPAQEFAGAVYATAACGGDGTTDQLLAIPSNSLSLVATLKPFTACGTSHLDDLFTRDADYQLAGCTVTNDLLFALHTGSSELVPLDMTGVATDAGPFSSAGGFEDPPNALAGMDEPSDLVMAGNILYVVGTSDDTDDAVVAISLDTGKQLWTKTLSGTTWVDELAATSTGLEVVAGNTGHSDSAALYTLSAVDGTATEDYTLTTDVATDFAIHPTYATIVGSDLAVLFGYSGEFSDSPDLGVLPLPSTTTGTASASAGAN
jgi:serine/threonine protein kinase